MKYGLSEESLNRIVSAISTFQEIKKAAIFGSRAMGNYKNGSDVDIVIYGEKISNEIVNSLSVTLNEVMPLPYYFDIVHYEALDHNGLRDHIDGYAIMIFRKN
ncbi:nucleotidyltransferase domain-containing protein [Alkaliphilus serpentinus]|uniref:Nucleotidyltransferase domain-containing protein n=1 Tax=Alkaliphilus serpentinus TaxID=1482731 RepID=A0A833M9D8_9FIRM|nr:nucleotidyltransferase domain-containing protein [Alkaliphilus serpentinus]KAB3529686.1 nucleotidyltransferase domain-containing protein [Alkaliphilus serpentinus]